MCTYFSSFQCECQLPDVFLFMKLKTVVSGPAAGFCLVFLSSMLRRSVGANWCLQQCDQGPSSDTIWFQWTGWSLSGTKVRLK